MPPVDYVKQGLIYVYSVCGGVVFSFLYDVLRVSRRSVRHSRVLVIVQDILYWMIISIGILLLIYRINEGEIRGFIIVGIICGAVLYFLIFSRVILFITVPIVSSLIKLIGKVIWVFTLPFKKIKEKMSISQGNSENDY